MIASAMSTGAPQGPTRMAPPMPSALMSPQGLPDRDRHGLNTDAFLGVGEERLLGEMPLSPGDLRSLLSAVKRVEPRSASIFRPPSPYPVADDVVGGLSVRSDVPNTSSISGWFDDYDVMPGIRKVNIKDWSKGGYASVDDNNRVRSLASEISQSKEINPLIVGVDKTGEPFIIEGGHRLGALQELGINEIPAVVVKELLP